MNKIIRDKRASVFDIFIWMIVGFILIVFLAAWMYGFGLITNTITTLDADTDLINITQAGKDTFGQANAGLSVFGWATGAIIFAMGLSIIISNFLVRAHPIFFVVYVLVVIVAVIFGAILSNAYESTVANNAIIGAQAKGFLGAHYIFMHLPIWVTIIGLLGAVFLYAGIVRDGGQGGSYL